MRIAEEDKIEEKKWRREREREKERQSSTNETKIEKLVSWKKKWGMKYDDDRKIKFEI